MLVSRSPEQIPAPASQGDGDGSRNCLPITLSQQEYATVLLTKHAQNILIVYLVMNEELITHAGGLVDTIEGIEIGLTLTSADGYSLTQGKANIVAPLFLHFC